MLTYKKIPHLLGYFFLSHNTKLLGKSFAQQKTTHEF